MYQNNIDLSLVILGSFLLTNVFGASGASSLDKNQASISKEVTENSTTLRSIEPSDNPDSGELKNLKFASGDIQTHLKIV